MISKDNNAIFQDTLSCEFEMSFELKPGMPKEEISARLTDRSTVVFKTLELIDETMPESGDEHREGEMLEWHHLDAKLNLLIELVSVLFRNTLALPAPALIRCSSKGAAWVAHDVPAVKGPALLAMYVHPAVPYPLEIPGEIAAIEPHAQGHRISFVFYDVPESITSALERLIFRHHRRAVAGAKRYD